MFLEDGFSCCSARAAPGNGLSMKSIRLSLVLGSWRLSGVYPARLQPEGPSRESQQNARDEKPPRGRSKAVSCSGARGQAELKQHEALSEARALRPLSNT